MLSLLPPSLSPKRLPFSTSNFLTDAFFATPNATLACCQFDINHYSIALFEKFGFVLPQPLQQAALKRQAEYLASRWLVATLLAQRGIPNWQLRNRNDRSPIWPTGIVGSLSHHRNKVFVVLDDAPALIGNDIELTISKQNVSDLASMIMDEEEAAILSDAGLSLDLATTLLFSVKETVYKAVYPKIQKIFDFSEVKLLFLTDNRATVRLSTTALPAMMSNDQWTVEYWQTDHEVLTWKIHHSL